MAEVAEPEFEGLLAAAGRSRAQVMALDLLADQPPMTEAQVGTLARRGVVPERNLTWLQASLLIDDANGNERGERTANWLCKIGASSQEAAKAVERAANDLRTRSGPRRSDDAVDVRLEVLETASQGRDLAPAAAGELAALRTAQAAAIRESQRQRRLEWARRSPADAPAPDDRGPAAHGAGRPSPRAGR